MAAYSVQGTVTPDSTTLSTGQPAGEHNGKDYWEWTTDGTTWFLWWNGSNIWFVSTVLGTLTPVGAWYRQATSIQGEYIPFPTSGATGTLTVAEIDQFIPLRISGSFDFVIMKAQ